MIAWLFRKFLKILLLFLILFVGITGSFQIPYVKNALKEQIQKELAKRGIKAEFSRLSGLMPLSFQVTDLSLESESFSLTAKSLSLSPSLSLLWGNTLAINSLRGKNLVYKSFAKEAIETPKEILPRNISLASISLEEIQVSPSFPAISVQGSCFLGKELRAMEANLKVRQGTLSMTLSLESKEDTLGSFSSHLTSEGKDKEGALNGSVYTYFSFANEALKRLLFFPEKPPLPLNGRIAGFFDPSPPSALIEEMFGQDLRISGQIFLYSDRSLITKRGKIASTSLSAPYSLSLGGGFALEKAQISLQKLSLASIPGIDQGSLQGLLSLEEHGGSLRTEAFFLFDKISALGGYLENASISYEGEIAQNACVGSFSLEGFAYSQPLEGSGDLTFDLTEGVFLENSMLTTAFGNASFDLHTGNFRSVEGEIHLSSDNFSTTFQENPFQAAVDLGITLSPNPQKVAIEGRLENLFFGHLRGEACSLEMDIFYIKHPQYKVTIMGENLRYQNHLAHEWHFSTDTTEENHPFSLSASGVAKEPFFTKAGGFWYQKQTNYGLTLQELEGFYAKESFFLEEPLFFEKTIDRLSLSFFQISFFEGFFSGECLITPKKKICSMQGEEAPLQLFSQLPYYLPMAGRASFLLNLEEIDHITKGSFQLSMSEASFFPDSFEEMDVTGSLRATFEKDRGLLDLSLKIDQDELLEFSAQIPCSLHWESPSLVFDEQAPLKGSFFYDGRLEHISDFISAGSSRFEGFVYGEMTLGGTWKHPLIEGDLLIKEGGYENDFLGTHLAEISAKIEGKGKNLLLSEIVGYDESGGFFHGEGSLSLDPRRKFPFTTSVILDDLVVTDIPIALTSASGHLECSGHLERMRVKGNVDIVEARLSIPSEVRPTVPVIPLANPPKSSEQALLEPTIYPVDLDLNISSKKTISIEGKGLISRWRGNFLIQGTTDYPRIKGELLLTQGNLVFAGRSFDLTEGSFTFEPNETLPLFSVKAVTTVLGTTITASLKGPLKEPKLSFTSSPSLPVSSILSLIIFGEEISELSVFQTATLAATAASLSGKGPDIFQSTRTTLGIDRFAVVHTPGSRQDAEDNSPETSALQVGKYIVDGVLLTFTQGLEEDSSNVGVQIDLHKGFIFQAETIRQQEQGQFSIRWNYNY
ncbi:MAG: translocation/assembly module TamB domain-containing protein [Chlamydiota bacterium]